MRKYFFNDKEHGFFKTQKRESPMNNPMAGKSHTLQPSFRQTPQWQLRC